MSEALGSRTAASAVGEPRPHRVLARRDLTDSVFVLRMERGGLQFLPGQWINVGLNASLQQREYTIYSTPADDYLELLVTEVRGGFVSSRLRRLVPGDLVRVEGPHGGFQIRDPDPGSGRLLFLATGTGISPFHCFTRSHAGLEYLLLHGTRSGEDRLELESFERGRLVRCVSRDGGGDYHGRITDYLRGRPERIGLADRHCYLCGNSDMISEAFAILRSAGVARDRIHTEVYF
jgi:ferredoxin/flavodoxin---NADP+ reductase